MVLYELLTSNQQKGLRNFYVDIRFRPIFSGSNSMDLRISRYKIALLEWYYHYKIDNKEALKYVYACICFTV